MFTFICFFLLCCNIIRIAISADLADGPTTVFILAGQSNMAGRGGVVYDTWDGYVPPECQPDPNILSLSLALTWDPAREPIHSGIDINKTVGIGPGMAFARTVLREDPNLGVIGLVPCAAGGTNISEWARGGHLYTRLIRRAEAAAGGGASIRALLWYQGESDTVNLEDAKKYRNRLRRFFHHVRTDLELPTLPIIQVALATKIGPYMNIVREAQLNIELQNVKTVDAKGLQAGYDYLHLTTASEVKLGQMLAAAFLDREERMPPPFVDATMSPPRPLHLQTSNAPRRRYANFVSGLFLFWPFR